MAKQFDGGVPQYGRKGFRVLTSATSAADDEFYWIICIADATVNITNEEGDSVTTQAMLAGTAVAVDATSIEETAGGVIWAYLK